MNAGHFGSHVTNPVAEMISYRGACKARELNKAFALAEGHSISRAVFVHGAAKVAEIVRRTPAALGDHHFGETENPR